MTLLFDIRVLWHSLTFTVRFLNSTFAFCIPSEPLRSLCHSFQRVKSRGSAIAVPEFASWIPRRLPQLFPRTLLIAVEKLYNRREKRSKYKFSETGKLVFVRCVGLSVLHFFGALLSFQMDDLLSSQLIVACSSSYQLSLKSKFCNCYTRFISLSRWSTQLQLNCSMSVAPDIWTSGVAFILMLL